MTGPLVGAIDGRVANAWTRRPRRYDLRVNRVVRRRHHRIGDLEFRLVELEGGDLSQLFANHNAGRAELLLPPSALCRRTTVRSGVLASRGRFADALHALLDEGRTAPRPPPI